MTLQRLIKTHLNPGCLSRSFALCCQVSLKSYIHFIMGSHPACTITCKYKLRRPNQLNNFTKFGMPVLVVLFLLVAAISITMTVTQENTLKRVAAAANTPVSNIETRLAQVTPSPNYAGNGQPAVSIPDQSSLSVPVNDNNYGNAAAQPSCHSTGTQVTGTTTGYTGGGCGGGKCGGSTGRLSSSSAGSTSGASCH